jgi:putative tricarboxylic transport membrane protein
MLFGTIPGLVFASISRSNLQYRTYFTDPLTFDLEAVPAIPVLLGVYAGGMFEGSISAILLGIPGIPLVAATVIDGYEMAKKGEAENIRN